MYRTLCAKLLTVIAIGVGSGVVSWKSEAQFITCCTQHHVTFHNRNPHVRRPTYSAIIYTATVDLRTNSAGQQVAVNLAVNHNNNCVDFAPARPDFLYTTQTAAIRNQFNLAINANFYNVGQGLNPYLVSCTSTYGMLTSHFITLNPNVPLPRSGGQTFGLSVFAIGDNRFPGVYSPLAPLPINIEYAVAGVQIVANGHNEVTTYTPSRIAPYIPRARTAIGYSASHPQILVIAVAEERQSDTGGVLLGDLADFLIRNHVTEAVALDGGGSSTLYYRPHGTESPFITRPADTHPQTNFRVHRPATSHLGFIEPSPPPQVPTVIDDGIYVSDGQNLPAYGGDFGYIGGPVVIGEEAFFQFRATDGISVPPNTALNVLQSGELQLMIQ